MAFFKLRKGGEEPASTARQPESIEALRKRARHRLIGAAVLVLIGIVGFPLLFDTQPRPIAVDIPIEIPDRNQAQPLPAPTRTPRVQAPAAPEQAVVPAVAKPQAQPEAPPQPAPEAQPPRTPPKAETRPEPRPEPKPEPKAVARNETKSPPPDDGAKALALLEGKEAPKSQPATAARFIVQVGAFADAAKARETRLKVERAGLKTYTHVAETKEGKRIRVRVGPFESKAEAEKAAGKIKGLDLPAAILTL